MTDDGIENYGAEAQTWNRGDGQPDPRLLDEALTRILQVCDPAEVILLGSAARGELRNDGDLDLLIFEDDPSNDRDTERLVRDAIEHLPRADVMTATRTEMREAAASLSRIHRTIATEGVTLYRNGRRLPYLRRPRRATRPRATRKSPGPSVGPHAEFDQTRTDTESVLARSTPPKTRTDAE